MKPSQLANTNKRNRGGEKRLFFIGLFDTWSTGIKTLQKLICTEKKKKKKSMIGGRWVSGRWSMVVNRSAGAKTIGGSVVGGRTVAGKTVAWSKVVGWWSVG